MKTAILASLGPYQRQLMLCAGLGGLTLVGRWAQGGDRPIIWPLRVLYAVFIAAALVYVWRDLLGNFPHIERWMARIARRARRRPMLGLYLVAVVGGVGGMMSILMVGDLGQDVVALVAGGSRDLVGFTGDNSRDVQHLLVTLILVSDLAVVARAFLRAGWRMEQRRVAAIRQAGAPPPLRPN